MTLELSMTLELKGWRAATAAGIAIVISLAGQPASARDRPGTPNNLTLRDCGVDNNAESICGTFSNTATEDVVIELTITENGQPTSPGVVLGCQAYVYRDPTAQHVPCVGQIQHYGDGQFDLRGAKFGTTYCIQLRARRTSDQVVSEIWSAPSCLTTGPAPPFPSAPDVDAQYSGTQVLVTRPTLERDTTSTVEFDLRQGISTGSDPQGWVFNATPGQDLLKITICKSNATGKNCASKVVSIVSKRDVEINGKSVQAALPNAQAPIARPSPAPQPPKPVPNPVIATGHPTAALNQAFMVGIDMPGADYRNTALNDNNANSCQEMCAKDAACLAWTWVKPGVQNPKAMCWLKNAILPSHPNANTTSGIKVTSTAVH